MCMAQTHKRHKTTNNQANCGKNHTANKRIHTGNIHRLLGLRESFRPTRPYERVHQYDGPAKTYFRSFRLFSCRSHATDSKMECLCVRARINDENSSIAFWLMWRESIDGNMLITITIGTTTPRANETGTLRLGSGATVQVANKAAVSPIESDSAAASERAELPLPLDSAHVRGRRILSVLAMICDLVRSRAVRCWTALLLWTFALRK